MGAAVRREPAELPELRDVRSDQQNRRAADAACIDRSRHRLAARHHAADDRRHALRRVRPAADLDDLHAAEPVPRRPRGAARSSATDPDDARTSLYVAVGRRRHRCRSAPSTTTSRQRTAPLAVNHQGQFPVGDASRSTWRRARRWATRSRRSRRRSSELGLPAEHPGRLPGHGAGVPGVAGQRAAPDPGGARHRLHRARRALRELHPSAHDPLDACRRPASARFWRCSCAGTEFSVIALIGIILLIGIVKKNAIMMIDFALEAEREEGRAAARGDLRGVPAALPADHDDDDGGAARRRCRSRSGTGIGSELRRPLGIAIVGGLILSQC